MIKTTKLQYSQQILNLKDAKSKIVISSNYNNVENTQINNNYLKIKLLIDEQIRVIEFLRSHDV